MNDLVSILQKGGIVLFPTDTIYGLGVDATNEEAVQRVRDLKGREEGKPISIMVSDMGMAESYAVVTPLAKRLADKFLPGKLTIVLEVKNTLPNELTVGTGSVGIRIPNHPLALQMVREFGKPITATSANVSDMPTFSSVPEILKQFGEKSTLINESIDAGPLPPSEPSTVVDARGEAPIVLREGAIRTEDFGN
ncbi:threonylcarbamoyl-AMP synthase [Candidatus Kaiserbacteria bacterium RIFCSPHIGHO2_01_FULL_48_10]|uniref:L-threonylcarbamoyladenylate synthase n=1 Tax=Candidatus Kaiserbacteria bacterium RIFCSPHIGHO2_01_FULL_48_10 TaxID=1798476 RepID=A0A1F6C2T2_9BACT|nr:MAG: threonylcarbamoyl-AMP synthase [Candidatus Kaiserbacteria bacterium RIFCSPHIGHO2_01_FULL_48_10]